jgi:hypothetical protein
MDGPIFPTSPKTDFKKKKIYRVPPEEQQQASSKAIKQSLSHSKNADHALRIMSWNIYSSGDRRGWPALRKRLVRFYADQHIPDVFLFQEARYSPNTFFQHFPLDFADRDFRIGASLNINQVWDLHIVYDRTRYSCASIQFEDPVFYPLIHWGSRSRIAILRTKARNRMIRLGPSEVAEVLIMTVHAPRHMYTNEVGRFFAYCNRVQQANNYLPLVVGADLNFDITDLDLPEMSNWWIYPHTAMNPNPDIVQKDYILTRSYTNDRFTVDLSYSNIISLRDLLIDPAVHQFPRDFLIAQNHDPLTSWVVVRQL